MPATRKFQARTQTRFALIAVALATGALAISPSIAAAGEEEDVTGVDAYLGDVVDDTAVAILEVDVERVLLDIAADLPLDHTPATPVDTPVAV